MAWYVQIFDVEFEFRLTSLGTGYHHMCAFFFARIFEHPRLVSTTYYMRMDTDSYILSPLCQDPFEIMHRRKTSYMYHFTLWDEPFATVGMWNYISDYAKSHPTIENRLALNNWTWPAERRLEKDLDPFPFPVYGNNFEVVALERFRKDDILAFSKDLMSDSKRIFHYRWGIVILPFVDLITDTFL